ncbi:MAG TPA: hypothetical protein VGE85_03545 [Terracidiphilus sp.]|jgi:hypothetical protein
MELRRLCAYNQTRECFLGLEVATASMESAELTRLFQKLMLKSGEGLWLSPFRGIPETDMRAPLDLIYLDEDCRVIEVVESYPTFRVSPSSPRPASVLALPIHSIYSSQSQSGDQLVLCLAEEMQGRLEMITSTSRVSSGVQCAVLLRAKPLWSGGPGVVELKDRPSEDRPQEERTKEKPLQVERSAFEKPSEKKFVKPSEKPYDRPPDKPSEKQFDKPSEKPYEMDLAEPGMKYVKRPKNWLSRWWSPDPRTAPDLRSAPRESLPGLAAYYWTGAAPKGHNVKNISSSGLYVVTEERWYPGTLILMTLQVAGNGKEEGFEHSIAVHSRAVRWGNDGVGLQFIPQDTLAASSGQNPLVNGANRRELEQFLERLRNGNG